MTLLKLIETLQEAFDIYGDMEIRAINDGEIFDDIEIECYDEDSSLYIELYHK